MKKVIINHKRKSSLFKNNITDSVFKSGMFIAIAVAILFVVSLVIFIVQAGVQSHPDSGPPGSGWSYFFTGNYFDGHMYFASGFMLINQLWTTLLAVIFAAPIGVITALFINKLAPKAIKVILLFAVTMLAAVPSVIFGAFGANWIDGAVKSIFGTVSGSTMSIVITLIMMVLPTITLVSISAINSVDSKIEQSSLALGASRSQTSIFVTLRAASPGILVAIVLAIGRVMGEASAVSMVAVPSYHAGEMWIFDNIRLLTATMLSGRIEMAPGSLQESMMMSQALMLISSIFLIFGLMKWSESRANIHNIAQKQIKQFAIKMSLLEKKRIIGFDKLTPREKSKINSMNRKDEKFKKIVNDSRLKIEGITKFSIINNSIKRSAKSKINYKKIQSGSFSSLTSFFSMFGLTIFMGIVVFLLIYGSQSLEWSYISGKGHLGLAYPFLNTLISLGITMGIALPLGVMGGIFFSEYVKKNGNAHKSLGTFFDLLAGIPSLIFGIVGYIVISTITGGIGALTTSITMVFMILPTIIRTTENALNSVYSPLKEGSLALGATKSKTAIKVSIPKALPNIISGTFLGAGRVVGESASIIFIIGTIPSQGTFDFLSPNMGGTTLATEIYKLTKAEIVDWNKVSAIGIVIISIILYLTGVAKQLENKKWLLTIIMISGFGGLTTGIMINNISLFVTSLTIGVGMPIISYLFKWINTKYGLLSEQKKEQIYKLASFNKNRKENK